MNQPHGWLILDKPRGLGSTQAVAAAKRNLREAFRRSRRSLEARLDDCVSRTASVGLVASSDWTVSLTDPVVSRLVGLTMIARTER